MIQEQTSADSGAPSSGRSTVALSLILVSHNSSHALQGFIDSLRDAPPQCQWELVVYDNASGDDSVSLLRNGFPHALILESSYNRGFAAAVNAAADRAGGEYFLLVNPDISWGEGVLDRLFRFLDNRPRAAAVTPSLRYSDGRSQPSLRRFPTHGNIWFSRGVPLMGRLADLLNWHPYTLPDPTDASRIEAVAAACFLIRASAFREIGRMDEEYFLYVEDTDLCRRLSDAGWELWMDPGAAITHQWRRNATESGMRKAHHRRGIRRYFRKFHQRKRVRNGILFLFLWMVDTVARITGSSRSVNLA